MVFCHKCGKEKKVFDHKFCGYCGTQFAGAESAYSRTTSSFSKPAVKCICDDCDFHCPSSCLSCHPPKAPVKRSYDDDY